MEEKEFPELAKYQRGLNDRIIFSKISGSTPLPNLVEIQTDSFKQFIDKGLDEVFKEVFPISSYSNQVSIIYDSCHFEAPEYTPLECKEGDLTYSAKLKVSLRLQQNNTGEIRESNEVFMGDIPMMTDSGTFIVNGAERVVVSQIVRSPGAYFQDTIDKSGVHIYNGEIIPNRGTWLQFESDLKGVLWVRIDRQRKIGFQGKAIRKRWKCLKDGVNAEVKVVCSEKRISQNPKNSLNQKVFCYELRE